MRKLFIKITPFFILTLLGLIATMVEIVLLLLSKDKGELATGILLILVIIFSSFLLLDRYLIKKFDYKKIILSEIIVLLILPFLVLYTSRETKIVIETQQPYYILVYSDKGISKDKIKSSGLFDHSLTLKNDNIIRLKYDLLNENNFSVIAPTNWNGHKTKRLDTIVNFQKIKIEMYSNNLSDETRDSIFKKLLPTFVSFK